MNEGPRARGVALVAVSSRSMIMCRLMSLLLSKRLLTFSFVLCDVECLSGSDEEVPYEDKTEIHNIFRITTTDEDNLKVGIEFMGHESTLPENPCQKALPPELPDNIPLKPDALRDLSSYLGTQVRHDSHNTQSVPRGGGSGPLSPARSKTRHGLAQIDLNFLSLLLLILPRHRAPEGASCTRSQLRGRQIASNASAATRHAGGSGGWRRISIIVSSIDATGPLNRPPRTIRGAFEPCGG